MIGFQLNGPNGLDALQAVVLPDPEPGPNDVIISARAWSMNYRDLAMPHGGYVGNDKVKRAPPLIPLSDVSGTVIAVGSDVRRLNVGDRLMSSFFTDWIDGDLTAANIATALGGATDGVLTESVCLPERAWVRIPSHLSYAEAATLPCAAVTAWHALTLANTRSGQTVLLLGTGGVSIFGLQFAKAAGARVIITSSSNVKLNRARELGADETINYKDDPNWQDKVREMTGGLGADHVLEVGGAGTLERSLASVRVSGTVSLIGVLARPADQNPSVLPALFNRITIRGIYVGSRRMSQEMVAAIEVNKIRPIIDRTFAFDDARAAYEYLQTGQHFGKVVIESPR